MSPSRAKKPAINNRPFAPRQGDRYSERLYTVNAYRLRAMRIIGSGLSKTSPTTAASATPRSCSFSAPLRAQCAQAREIFRSIDVPQNAEIAPTPTECVEPRSSDAHDIRAPPGDITK